MTSPPRTAEAPPPAGRCHGDRSAEAAPQEGGVGGVSLAVFRNKSCFSAFFRASLWLLVGRCVLPVAHVALGALLPNALPPCVTQPLSETESSKTRKAPGNEKPQSTESFPKTTPFTRPGLRRSRPYGRPLLPSPACSRRCVSVPAGVCPTEQGAELHLPRGRPASPLGSRAAPGLCVCGRHPRWLRRPRSVTLFF